MQKHNREKQPLVEQMAVTDIYYTQIKILSKYNVPAQHRPCLCFHIIRYASRRMISTLIYKLHASTQLVYPNLNGLSIRYRYNFLSKDPSISRVVAGSQIPLSRHIRMHRDSNCRSLRLFWLTTKWSQMLFISLHYPSCCFTHPRPSTSLEIFTY